MKKFKGRRYNSGKLRFELISEFALEEIARVYTEGAKKYSEWDGDGNLTYDGANNWRFGLSWMDCVGSAKRHINKFLKNVDFDDETKCYHLAHACWNLMTILDFYKTFPQGDDRIKKYMFIPKIGLDIDGVIANFSKAWATKYPELPIYPSIWKYDRNILDRFEAMKSSGELDNFYLNIEPLITVDELPFEPHCYVTSRPVSTKITEEWLKIHGYPASPVYSVGTEGSKVEAVLSSGCDIFIDDSYKNFIELNGAGIYTLLYSALWNQRYDVGNMRINNLTDLPYFN